MLAAEIQAEYFFEFHQPTVAFFALGELVVGVDVQFFFSAALEPRFDQGGVCACEGLQHLRVKLAVFHGGR